MIFNILKTEVKNVTIWYSIKVIKQKVCLTEMNERYLKKRSIDLEKFKVNVDPLAKMADKPEYQEKIKA